MTTATQTKPTFIKNINWDSRSNNWRVRVHANGNTHHVGSTSDSDVAIDMYNAKAAELGVEQIDGYYIPCSNVPGIFWDNSHGKWRVQVRVNGTRISGGRHRSFEEALKTRNRITKKNKR